MIITSGFSQTKRVNAAIRLGAGPYIENRMPGIRLGKRSGRCWININKAALLDALR